MSGGGAGAVDRSRTSPRIGDTQEPDAPVAAPPPPTPAATGTPSALRDDPTLQAVLRGERELGRGDRGPAVRAMQQALMAAGSPLPRFGADSDFGGESANTLAAFQRAQGLSPSGRLDRDTLQALDRAAAPAPTSPTGPGAPTTGPTAPTGPGAPPAQASSGRFAGDPTLVRVLAGRASLGPGAPREATTRAQQALTDIGYHLPVDGVDGGFGGESARAVRRFQQDAGLPQTGRVDRTTLQALDRAAPPAGQRVERYPEYDRLYADGRLDTTVAFGYDEGQGHLSGLADFQEGLRGQGYRQLDVSSLSAARRQQLGLGPDRHMAGATYYHRQIQDPSTGRDVDAVVRIIHPGSAAQPEQVRDMFARAMAQDEVVVYDGHARYGTGPDFDPIGSGRGNFVIDRGGNPAHPPPADLRSSLSGAPDTMLRGVQADPNQYRLMWFSSCNSESYLRNIRNPQLNRTLAGSGNTDVLATTTETAVATGSEHLLRFLGGIGRRESIDAIQGDQNRRESEFWGQWPSEERHSREARGAFEARGFLGNRGNRTVPQ